MQPLHSRYESESLLEMAEFYVGGDRLSGLEIYLIPDCHSFMQQKPELAKYLMGEARKTQGEFWNSVYDIYHNTFEPGSLILFMDDEAVAGFASFSVSELTPSSSAVYYSDIMLSKKFRGKAISYLIYALTNSFALEGKSAAHKVVNFMISGNLNLFFAFEKLQSFVKSDINKLTATENVYLESCFQRDFGQNYSIESGKNIIRKAWAPQAGGLDLDKLFWNKDKAIGAGFPGDLSYTNGDVHIAAYCLEHSELIEIDTLLLKRIKKHIKNL